MLLDNALFMDEIMNLNGEVKFLKSAIMTLIEAMKERNQTIDQLTELVTDLMLTVGVD